MKCSGNLANNRQTQMMADLQSLNCTSDTPTLHVKKKMLESAKVNLVQFPMFGLNEYLYASQYLFTWTFDLHFKSDIKHKNSTHFTMNMVSDEDLQCLTILNAYDIQLYEFARRLFLTRLRYAVLYDTKHGKYVPESIREIVDDY